jgi:hypothetical protein
VPVQPVEREFAAIFAAAAAGPRQAKLERHGRRRDVERVKKRNPHYDVETSFVDRYGRSAYPAAQTEQCHLDSSPTSPGLVR